MTCSRTVCRDHRSSTVMCSSTGLQGLLEQYSDVFKHSLQGLLEQYSDVFKDSLQGPLEQYSDVFKHRSAGTTGAVQ